MILHIPTQVNAIRESENSICTKWLVNNFTTPVSTWGQSERSCILEAPGNLFRSIDLYLDNVNQVPAGWIGWQMNAHKMQMIW